MKTNGIIIKKFAGKSGATVVLAWHGDRRFSVTANNAVAYINYYNDATAAYLDAVYSINDPLQSANVRTEWNELPKVFGFNSKYPFQPNFSKKCQLLKSWDDYMEF